MSVRTGLVGLGFSFCLACCLPAAEDKGRVKKDRPFGPPPHATWKPLPDFTDEFDGDKLDPAKWHDHNPKWKGRQPGFFAKHNVTVSDGKLHITMRAEDLPNLPDGYHTFTCGAVKSTRTVLYGYFEAKCKPMASRGSSAFWFYNSQSDRWTEIDVFEIGGGAPKHKRTVHTNVHVFHTPTEKRHWAKAGQHQVPFDLADSYHVYGLEWDKDRITFYFDGVPVRSLQNTHWHQPLHLNFDSETMPKWFGLPQKKHLPSVFSIEHIRAWKRVGKRAAEPQSAPANTEERPGLSSLGQSARRTRSPRPRRRTTRG